MSIYLLLLFSVYGIATVICRFKLNKLIDVVSKDHLILDKDYINKNGSVNETLLMTEITFFQIETKNLGSDLKTLIYWLRMLVFIRYTMIVMLILLFW